MKLIFTSFLQVTSESETSNVENEEMVGATLTQSTAIKPDDTQVIGEIDSTTPNESVPDTPTEQTVADSQVLSINQVIIFRKNSNTKMCQ